MTLSLVAVVLGACGSSAQTQSTNLSASPGAAVQPSSSPSPTATPLDAAGMVAKLKAAGLPIGTVIVYSATTDVNHLLGRPNGYLSKANFVDKRITASAANYLPVGDVSRGGSVEVFKAAAGAQARMKYLQGIDAAMPILGAEYDYVVGDALIRVSDVLTPSQARAYRIAAEK
jgi:hypothetical protein